MRIKTLRDYFDHVNENSTLKGGTDLTTNNSKKWIVVGLSVLLFVFFVSTSFAQEPVIYPAKGQSTEQMEKDKTECNSWAKKQTGFDPMQTQQSAQTSSQGPTGERARGAARGAAIGAASGGDAGKGAAVGAAAGGVKKRHEKRQARKQQDASAAAGMDKYNKAYGACLEGRGYTVK